VPARGLSVVAGGAGSLRSGAGSGSSMSTSMSATVGGGGSSGPPAATSAGGFTTGTCTGRAGSSRMIASKRSDASRGKSSSAPKALRQASHQARPAARQQVEPSDPDRRAVPLAVPLSWSRSMPDSRAVAGGRDAPRDSGQTGPLPRSHVLCHGPHRRSPGILPMQGFAAPVTGLHEDARRCARASLLVARPWERHTATNGPAEPSSTRTTRLPPPTPPAGLRRRDAAESGGAPRADRQPLPPARAHPRQQRRARCTGPRIVALSRSRRPAAPDAPPCRVTRPMLRPPAGPPAGRGRDELATTSAPTSSS
jgi:hypothetical protein